MMPKKSATTETRDWKHTRVWWIKALKNQTGRGLAYWNKRIAETSPLDKHRLQSWLKQEGVTGYAAQVLVMERFGYPDFIEASGNSGAHRSTVKIFTGGNERPWNALPRW